MEQLWAIKYICKHVFLAHIYQGQKSTFFALFLSNFATNRLVSVLQKRLKTWTRTQIIKLVIFCTDVGNWDAWMDLSFTHLKVHLQKCAFCWMLQLGAIKYVCKHMFQAHIYQGPKTIFFPLFLSNFAMKNWSVFCERQKTCTWTQLLKFIICYPNVGIWELWCLKRLVTYSSQDAVLSSL